MNTVKVNLKQPEVYKDFILYASFESEPYANNKAIATNLEVTKQELDSLFNTKKYERPYQPDYYNPLEELLGELYTDQTITMANHLVYEKVNRFIPKIRISGETNFIFENHKLTMNLIFYYANDFNKVLYNYERQFDTIT